MKCSATAFDRQLSMPHSSEEPPIHPSVPGPRDSAAPARTPQTSRTASPGPRPGPRPAPPRADRSRPGPGRPTPAARPSAGAQGQPRPGGQTSGQLPTPRAARSAAAESAAPSTGAEPTPTTAKIELVNTTDAQAVEAADETVDRLLDGGRAPSDVLVFTTGEQHPWAQHELSFGEDTYWRHLSEGEDMFAAHVSAADRTSSRPVVVLAVNGGSDADVAAALPVALGRATDELIVCGDPSRLRALL